MPRTRNTKTYNEVIFYHLGCAARRFVERVDSEWHYYTYHAYAQARAGCLRRSALRNALPHIARRHMISMRANVLRQRIQHIASFSLRRQAQRQRHRLRCLASLVVNMPLGVEKSRIEIRTP